MLLGIDLVRCLVVGVFSSPPWPWVGGFAMSQMRIEERHRKEGMVCCPNHSFRIENQTSHLPTPSPHFIVGLLYSTASRRAFEMGKEPGDIAWWGETGTGTQTWVQVLVLPPVGSVTWSKPWNLLSFCFFTVPSGYSYCLPSPASQGCFEDHKK